MKESFSKGAEYQKAVQKSIKTKLCSKAEEWGIVIELAQKRSMQSMSFHPTEYLINEDETVVVFGNDRWSFYFSKEKIVRMASMLDIRVKNNIAYIHLPFEVAKRHAEIVIDHSAEKSVSLKEKTEKVLERVSKKIKEKE